MTMHPSSRFRIVPRDDARRGRVIVLVACAWAVSLALAWYVSSRLAAPRLDEVSRELRQAQDQLKVQRDRVKALGQREAVLSVSDRISRTANTEIQSALAERDEEIAGLRADIAFYERLVGATSQPRGLGVHRVEFLAEADGLWRYQITLAQTLNRGAISEGQLEFSVEGVRDGKLSTIAWDDLHQRADVPAQDYSFRYFQQLEGNVMLPAGFSPQRVRVSLRSQDEAVEQDLDWNVATTAGGA